MMNKKNPNNIKKQREGDASAAVGQGLDFTPGRQQVAAASDLSQLWRLLGMEKPFQFLVPINHALKVSVQILLDFIAV